MSRVPTESSMLFLSTRDSINPETPHDSTFILNGAIATNVDDYSLSVQSIEIPNLRYPINSYTNKIYFRENVGPTLIATLPSQTYTGSQLATEIGTQLSAASTAPEVWTGTYNGQTGKITITGASGLVSITFLEGANDSSEVSGLTASVTLLGGGTANNTVRLDGTTFLDVITNISTDNYSSDLKSNILFRIPVLQSFGTIIFFQNATDDYISTNADSIQTLDIRLIDDQGRLFILPSNATVSIVMKLTPVF